MNESDDPVADFIRAACVPRDTSHASGTLERAESIRAARPEVASANIHTAAILGDDEGVRRFLARDPGDATAKGGPYDWDALTHLCFSRYLRLDPARSAGFVRAATALLDAGASPNTGWQEEIHDPKPTWESVLYGAAGIARHPELTRLLLERGGDPNDDETPYHSAESHDNRAVRALLGSGKLTPANLAIILLRKADCHDASGVRLLLDHGADPNRMTMWGRTALHQAIVRDNALETIDLLLERGADPTAMMAGRTAIAIAARRGRGDVLDSLERRGVALGLEGADRLIAACARDDAAAVRSIVASDPALAGEIREEGGTLLAEFAGNGNRNGVERLLDLGVDVDARFERGDGYFDVAPRSTALHVAAWRARSATVKLLLDRGAAVAARDARGRTPLALAVRACVDSYWTERRSPESVEALLRAGASTDGVLFPCGYDAVDTLLARHRGSA